MTDCRPPTRNALRYSTVLTFFPLTMETAWHTAGNGLALPRGNRRQQRARRRRTSSSMKFALTHPAQQMPAQDAGAAPAAGAAGVNVLPFGVKDHDAAVVVATGEDQTRPADSSSRTICLPSKPQVSGDDQVVVLRAAMEILKMLPDACRWQRAPSQLPCCLRP